MTIRIMVSADDADIQKARPLLKRQGMTISSYFRKAIADFIEANERKDMVINIDDVEARR